jgi:hypothetical protein
MAVALRPLSHSATMNGRDDSGAARLAGIGGHFGLGGRFWVGGHFGIAGAFCRLDPGLDSTAASGRPVNASPNRSLQPERKRPTIVSRSFMLNLFTASTCDAELACPGRSGGPVHFQLPRPLVHFQPPGAGTL